jgi:DNA-directed RNA polymerase beta subunit
MKNKIPVLTLLQAMGLSSKKILYSIKSKEFLTNITNTKITSSVQKALKKINDIMFYKQSNVMRLNKNFI